MARRVFFSFHYDRDVRRIVQVRNSCVVRRESEAPHSMRPTSPRSSSTSAAISGDTTVVSGSCWTCGGAEYRMELGE